MHQDSETCQRIIPLIAFIKEFEKNSAIIPPPSIKKKVLIQHKHIDPPVKRGWFDVTYNLFVDVVGFPIEVYDNFIDRPTLGNGVKLVGVLGGTGLMSGVIGAVAVPGSIGVMVLGAGTVVGGAGTTVIGMAYRSVQLAVQGKL